MSQDVLDQIEADIAETERLMTELRLKLAVSKSAGANTAEDEKRLQEMLKGWMMLQDQRQKAAEAGHPGERPIAKQGSALRDR
jgi:hypothetical protein